MSLNTPIFSIRVGLGDPAAHRTDCLPLLPSGSGGVHRVLLHRAQPLFSIETFQPRPSFRCLSARGNYDTAIKSRRYTQNAVWRRGWDSNPRSRCRDACFPSMSIRPLSHLSASRSVKGEHLSMRVHDQQGDWPSSMLYRNEEAIAVGGRSP
jgi:hypothetical protein